MTRRNLKKLPYTPAAIECHRYLHGQRRNAYQSSRDPNAKAKRRAQKAGRKAFRTR